MWTFVSDPELLPEWLEELREVSVQSDGPIGKGTVFRYTIDPGARSSIMHFVDWQPGRRFAWDGPPSKWHGGAARPRGHCEVTGLGEGRTRLICCFRPELTGTMALLAPVMKRWLRKRWMTDAAALKALLEKAPSESPST